MWMNRIYQTDKMFTDILYFIFLLNTKLVWKLLAPVYIWFTQIEHNRVLFKHRIVGQKCQYYWDAEWNYSENNGINETLDSNLLER